jgi:hypothetical protein
MRLIFCKVCKINVLKFVKNTPSRNFLFFVILIFFIKCLIRGKRKNPHYLTFLENGLKLNGIKGQLNKFKHYAVHFFGTPEKLKTKIAFMNCFRILPILAKRHFLFTINKIKGGALIFISYLTIFGQTKVNLPS